ncbi:PaaX family transcriptional regulator C-terminal domain-containing protein [Amycolatopsis sp.]|uniref:PaaX family transcriptional regulator n=1 Tax=Amycolatopsis sp. TaxID=37632 RepID=UPI002D7EC3EE|nr:PaaX family transcriptional regulator C-terminal domain-containing protein [Amycolatopsis sp.]HET6711051.1 PaaX family transcriptional regulator C-terminal domain-containing protein [Amycolatopsis sp.]
MLEAVGRADDEGAPGVRPEALLLTLFGDHVLDRGVAVSTGGVIAVLDRLGVGAHATRATLSRMTRRDLLRTVRRGRQAFLALTAHGTAVLRDGQRKLDGDVVDRHWDGRWTLLTFSVPESRRADRYALRTRLGWFGFGPLRSGLWVSASAADISAALAELDLIDHAEVFRAEPFMWTDPVRIAREAWDLPRIAAGYEQFLRRWGGRAPGDLGDALSCRIRLGAEWLLLIRRDPVLPPALLPPDWPGTRAAALFRALRRQWTRPAEELAGGLLEFLVED